MRAHELAAGLDQNGADYRRVMAAVKFDLGATEKVQALAAASTKTFFEIPAPVCLFQVDQEDVTEFYLAWHECGGTVWRYYVIRSGEVLLNNIEFFIDGDGKQLFLSYIDTNQLIGLYKDDEGAYQRSAWESLDAEVQFMIDQFVGISSAIEVFSCCNVAQVEHTPDQRRNAKRIAKNKVPLFSYRTLHITSDAAPRKGEATSATHASPRLHLRRGHIRRLADERRIWVRASLVGDKTKGFVGKEYAIG